MALVEKLKNSPHARDVHVAKSLCDVAKATCEVASEAGQLLGSSELIDMEVETPLLPLGDFGVKRAPPPIPLPSSRK